MVKTFQIRSNLCRQVVITIHGFAIFNNTQMRLSIPSDTISNHDFQNFGIGTRGMLPGLLVCIRRYCLFPFGWSSIWPLSVQITCDPRILLATQSSQHPSLIVRLQKEIRSEMFFWEKIGATHNLYATLPHGVDLTYLRTLLTLIFLFLFW